MSAPGTALTDKARTKRRRVTFVIDEQIDNLLEMYCNASHQQKNSVAELALGEHLSRKRKEVHDAVKKTEAAINQLPSLR